MRNARKQREAQRARTRGHDLAIKVAADTRRLDADLKALAYLAGEPRAMEAAGGVR